MLSADTPPAHTKNVAMAYQAHTSAPKPAMGETPSRAWDDLRREARRLEGELDCKLSAFNKLCSGYEGSAARDGVSGAGAEQLSTTKAAEIEALLTRLSDVNDQMGALLGSGQDSRAHLLARHRDILQENSHEFRRLTSSLGAARDRVALLATATPSGAHVSLQVQGSTGALLRERAAVQSSTSAIDNVISQAQAVSSNLVEQRHLLRSVGEKVISIGARFPVVNSLLNAIRRKKSKDALVLGGVIAGCVLFTLLYLLFK